MGTDLIDHKLKDSGQRAKRIPWLEVIEVEAWLGQKQVFKNLNLSIMLGQNTAILGPNGSGKSSLCQLISRNVYPVVKPGSSVKLFGSETVNIWKLRSRIGVVLTDWELRVPATMSVEDVVISAFFGSVGLGRNQIPSIYQQKKVKNLLEKLNLIDLADRSYTELSDGQRRRIQIARALVHSPEVLVLDEPTNGLDIKAKNQLLRMLRELCRSGTSLLHITHQVDTIFAEIDRLVFMKDGIIFGDGSPQQLLSSTELSKLYETPLEVLDANGYWQVLPGKSETNEQVKPS